MSKSMTTEAKEWYVYHGNTSLLPEDTQTLPGPHELPEPIDNWLSDAPPWRTPSDRKSVITDQQETGKQLTWKERWQQREDRVERRPPRWDGPSLRRGKHYVTTNGNTELDRVNIALRLRRPLLVRGVPGIGKSSLAYSIAHHLGLAKPLRWEVSSQTTLQEALYVYDAVSHLHANHDQPNSRGANNLALGEYITLGPLGTALLPTKTPRVLLIDELDKASYDLPNDLLHVFEEGRFVITELSRKEGKSEVKPYDYQDSTDTVPIFEGRVETFHYPVVVITTNDEREFPPAFLRRCVELTLKSPDPSEPKGREVLRRLASEWFHDHTVEDSKKVLDQLLDSYKGTPAILLQALFLAGYSGEESGHVPPDTALKVLQGRTE